MQAYKNMGDKQKILGIELLKFLAAVLITNSHFKALYVEPYTPLGTFGAPGNALFFFISGYTLMLGRKGDFTVWYKRRIQRIWPSIIAWSAFVAPVFFRQTLHWQDIWLAGNYWFVHCIVIYYALFYFLIPYLTNLFKHMIVLSVILAALYFFFIMPMTPFSIYLESFHYICFFGIMLMGAYLASKRNECKPMKTWKCLSLAFLMLILFYALQVIGKGKNNFLYYFQILSLLSLYGFIYYAYMSIRGAWADKLVKNTICGTIIRFVAALTLEVYLVGFLLCFCMMGFNDLFPFNLIMALVVIVFVAYIVKIVSNFFIQTFSPEPYNLRKIFVII